MKKYVADVSIVVQDLLATVEASNKKEAQKKIEEAVNYFLEHYLGKLNANASSTVTFNVGRETEMYCFSVESDNIAECDENEDPFTVVSVDEKGEMTVTDKSGAHRS